MLTYLVHRLVQTVFSVLILSFVVFILMQLLPGDPVAALFGNIPRTEAEYLRIKHEFWLDRPIVIQYFHWLDRVFHGDLGRSIAERRQVADMIRAALPITINLSVTAVIVAALFGIPFGIISAIRRGGFWDTLITTTANIGVGIPAFWLGILLIYFISYKSNLLPISGYTSPFDDFWLHIKKMILPVISLSFAFIAFIARQMRSVMLEVIHQDYIRTARAKGLSAWLIIMRHALKNALIPIVTTLGVTLGHLIGGTVLIETVFNIPGMGRMIVESIWRSEFFVMQGSILVIGVIVAVLNLIVDVLYTWLDPRIRVDR